MKDLSAAERRLIAALDRLDNAVERAARRIAEPPQPGRTGAAAPVPGTGAEISPQIAALHDRQAATLEAMQMRLAEAQERLAAAGEQAARLAAANDDLARANRALVEAAGGGPETWAERGEPAALAALHAEVEALRAARAAEVAQMSEILDALDRMLGVTTTPRSHSTQGLHRGSPQGGAGKPADQDPVDGSGQGALPQADGGPVMAEGRDGGEDVLPEEGPADEIRELSVLRDEDPLPEDELAPELGTDDRPPRTGLTPPDAAADDTEQERR